MNEDGSLGIPHGASQEEETPTAEPTFSGGQEETKISSTDASTVDDTAITHDSPIEAPNFDSNEEPKDIFASLENQTTETATTKETIAEQAAPNITSLNNTSAHHIANNPFHNRNRFETANNTNATQANSNVPQFFNDAIIANTPNNQPKRSKKSLFIGIIIGGIALIAIALIISLAIKNNSRRYTDANGNVVDTHSKEDFYKYANLLINGTDSTSKIEGSFSSSESYYYQSKISGTDLYDQSYVNSLSDQYNTFYDNFSKANENLSNGKAYNYINGYKDLLDFIKKNPLNENYRKEAIISTYVTQGREAASSATNKILGKFNSEKNDHEKSFYQLKQIEFSNLLLLLDEANAKGCIKNNELIEQCIDNNIFLDDSENDLKQTVLTNSYDSNDYVMDSYSKLGYDCWQIADALENIKGEK